MEAMEIIWNLFAFLIGMVSAFLLMLVIVGNKITILHEKIAEEKSMLEDSTRMITVEKVDGTFLVHDAETNDFVCQVTTFEELRKKLYHIDPKAEWLLEGDESAMDELRRGSDVKRV